MSVPSALTHVLISKQTDFETAATPTKHVGLVVTSANAGGSAEVQESQGIGALETTHVSDGLVTTNLSLEGEFQNGRLLELVLGGVTHAQHASTDDWTHTYSIEDSDYATVQIAYNLPTAFAENITGLTVNSATISTSLNERVTLNVDFQGRTRVPGATVQTAAKSTLPVFSQEDVTITMNSQTPSEIQDFEITFSKNPQSVGGLGSNIPQQIHATELKVAFSGTLGFTDEEYHELFTDRTMHEIVFDAHNGVALGSGRRQLYIKLEKCLLTEQSVAVSVGGINFVNLSGIGVVEEAYSVDDITSATW